MRVKMAVVRSLPWLDALFMSIWLVTAVIFFVQAHSAYLNEFMRLPPYTTTIPANYNIEINGLRFQDVINGLTASYDQNVAALQTSIRASATLSFWLNLMSGFLALVGMSAQVGQIFRDRRRQ